ncbi:MAG: hypothetical protein JWM27_4971 [Gemmatimonadetes bacterium]|nr:hypothetical protein [Gemmatimonadota bacterium]
MQSPPIHPPMPNAAYLALAGLLLGASLFAGRGDAWPGAHVPAEARAILLRGTVWDSTAGGPLAGARVFLMGTEDTAVTDAAGVFSLEHGMDGRYRVSFSHPRLDSLGYVPDPVLAELAEGALATVQLAIPSMRAVRQSLCGERAAADSGVVVGSVVRPAGVSVEGVEVRFAWDERFNMDTQHGTRINVESAAAGTLTDAAGRFRVCGVALQVPVRATLRIDGRDRAVGMLRLRELTPYRYDVRTR